MSKTAYLVLENGKIFKGKSFGAEKEVISEIVFTTGMTGYLETLTDKSYYGQAAVQTFPLIGNYGVIPQDFESDGVYMDAYICKNVCDAPSNFRSTGALDEFLKRKGVPGLYDIDTRALTKIIRESGVMNGMLTYDLSHVDPDRIKAYKVERAVESVSTKKPYIVKGEGRYRIALYDFGLKENIVRYLVQCGCDVYVYPYNTKVEKIMECQPNGIVLSNGPGDPAENVGVIAELKKLPELKIPVLGICLGHQLIALAHGFKTEKLKYGHRGANQPVKDTETGRVYITSQNHGYAVVGDSVDPKIAEQFFVNVNDGTCEGLKYFNEDIVTAQFHPEACGGPHDTNCIFDRFVASMEERICR